MEKIYPLGSVVYLKQSKDKIMIISRGAIYGEDDEERYYDYMGCVFPQGFDKERTLFFNNDNIDDVIFEGYSDEDEKRLVHLYTEWTKTTNVLKGND